MKIDHLLLDTNILLRAQAVQDAEHAVVAEALRWCGRNQVRLYVSVQSLYEMWVVLTRPRAANGYGLSPAEAANQIRAVQQLFTILADPPELPDRWLSLCERHSVLGKQAHDARLVATMLCYEIPYLVTLNKSDFARFQSEIVCLEPEELVAGGE